MGKHTLHRLTAREVTGAKDRGHYPDGGGLYLRVGASGTRSWIFRYTRQDKTREMGLGAVKDVTLVKARHLAAEARELLRGGLDPIDTRTGSTTRAARASAVTFQQCAERYIEAKRAGWKNAKHAAQWGATLAQYASPIIGALSVADVTLPHVLQILEPIWTTKTETASRLRGRIQSVLDYATARGYRTGDNPARWTGHLKELLPAPGKVAKVEHHAALPWQEIGAFMAELRQQAGMGARALELAILTAARSGEVRGATWAEVGLAQAVWTIPAARMKAAKEHRVPLSAEAVELLRTLPRIDGSELLFPNSKGAALSDMTLSAVLKRMGRAVTTHGFRSTFRDWAGECTAYPREVIEHALAHQLRDRAEAAYARGTLFDKRRRLMAEWAQFCGIVAPVAGVVPLRRGA
ncbi:tyrosine-type recombinase/integrase [Immundisolibacter cernigliae]|uniref:Integrase n=1 Tax=Immundisolibacter cernigliae TaxID=1810504 RepID=A0A1B1YXB7_9GAMM|nr:integrase arm-type DNA-binding domain-containing protein [Immundisolibacter cernigliae]ANX05388.1 integrase [Immundisolibacter cernigliae]